MDARENQLPPGAGCCGGGEGRAGGASCGCSSQATAPPPPPEPAASAAAATGDDAARTPERLVELRLAALTRAGFPPVPAARLAARLDIDYLEAIAVLRQGFPAEVAAEILLSGGRSVF